MTSFTDLTKQVHTINDMILSNMTCDPNNPEKEVSFSKHLLATKLWFAYISYVNKKRYLLLLLQDVRSVWTLSLLLKSIWNCRPKDAVMSASEKGLFLSSYDQVPMDHNRTAIPAHTLALVMKNDRLWFLSLEPEPQAVVLSELLTVAGGPVMWDVFHRAQTLYERYQEQMFQNLSETIVVENTANKTSQINSNRQAPEVETKTEPIETTAAQPSNGQKNYQANIQSWNATIKAMRDNLKLEEMEMRFNDGTTRKIWKVNRPKPDNVETIDFVQMLPSAVGKRILSFLPRGNLVELGRVNKYWAYLVDEYLNEVSARSKISSELERLEKLVIKFDDGLFTSNNDLHKAAIDKGGTLSNQALKTQNQPSVKHSVKSAGIYSLRHFSHKLNIPKIAQKQIWNMAELYERLDRRGAADENLWGWCEYVIANSAKEEKEDKKKVIKGEKEVNKKLPATENVKGILLSLEKGYFPIPLMKHNVVVPLKPPLYKDPSEVKRTIKLKKRPSDANVIHYIQSSKEGVKRYNPWTRDVTSLYPVFKVPSYYEFPLI